MDVNSSSVLGSNSSSPDHSSHLHLHDISGAIDDKKICNFDIPYIMVQLRAAQKAQADRGLNIAARFASELLLGCNHQLYESTTSDSSSSENTNADRSSKKERDASNFALSMLNNGDYLRCAHYLRKSFTSNQNDKMRFTMTSCVGVFLASYSLYMAGEKARDHSTVGSESETSEGVQKRGDKNSIPIGKREGVKDGSISYIFNENVRYPGRNPYLNDLYKELLPMYLSYTSSEKGDAAGPPMDGYLMFLFAVVVRGVRSQGCSSTSTAGGSMPAELVDMENNLYNGAYFGGVRLKIPPSRRLFIEAVRLQPWNWSAWLELSGDCCERVASGGGDCAMPSWEELLSPEPICAASAALKPSDQAELMHMLFLIHTHLELQQGDVALHLLQGSGILQSFPLSQVLLNARALSYYCMRDYDRAQDAFEQARDLDPHRLDHVDTYSNILYVKERKAELSFLAHSVSDIDKYRPETCCVVGNYYSLKGQHERAIVYFQRALKLDNRYLSAWTLMGHEFVELRNTAAAVQCYRKAVDVSARDYRAWYGLGQTYEMLHMYQYALHYYKKSASLKSNDARMWCAVGNCLSRLNCKSDATLALERAVSCGDREGIATRELARLYRDAGLSARAAECYHKHLQALGIGNATTDDGFNSFVVDSERAEALLYLASYHRNQRDFFNAECYCNKLADYVGPEGEEARAILREIRSITGTGGAEDFMQETED